MIFGVLCLPSKFLSTQSLRFILTAKNFKESHQLGIGFKTILIYERKW